MRTFFRLLAALVLAFVLVIGLLVAYWYWRPDEAQVNEGIVTETRAVAEDGRSTDGIDWEIVSTINTGGKNDETEIEILPDGSLRATARLEDGEFADGMFGDERGATLISEAAPPFVEWSELTQSPVARLDGPVLFTYRDRTYAVGRFPPDLDGSGPFTRQGSVFARKPTSIDEVRPDGLAYLSDLPSAGDTSYVGLITDGDTGYATYSRTDRDFPWLMGMLSPSAVKMATIDLATMEAAADATDAA